MPQLTSPTDIKVERQLGLAEMMLSSMHKLNPRSCRRRGLHEIDVRCLNLNLVAPAADRAHLLVIGDRASCCYRQTDKEIRQC
jgi:hypothetical protein